MRTSKIHRFLIEQLLIKLNKPLKTEKIKEKKEREKILKKRMGLLSQAAKRAMLEMAPKTTFKTTKKERKVAMTRKITTQKIKCQACQTSVFVRIPWKKQKEL
ncbi:uncharacterized protein LOC130612266 isoform X2 [Hydractinia symbiolongicarpus]|uniref:uncharacterized protein LOC130612266 isoform X2 n=1 Tax=Hydractinia symbiolongicarpus TaxID=13093 RepID=UPI00254E5C14|nr:uncharacterized protein LOC130612266 isoform X2 [Hydractinia symbiolongicarpus]